MDLKYPVKALIIPAGNDLPKVLQQYLQKNHIDHTLVNTNRELEQALQKETYAVLMILRNDGIHDLAPVLQQHKNEINTMITVCYQCDDLNEHMDIDFTLSEHFFQNQENVKAYFSGVFKLAAKRRQQIELSSLLLHDLRSPTQSIISYLELIHNEVFGEINTGQKQILANAMTLGDNLIQLIESLGLTYQFEQNQFMLRKQKVDLNELLTRTLRNVWIQADKKDIKLVPEVPSQLPPLHIDSYSIERVLINLLTNAINYSPEKSTVQLIVKPLRTKENNQTIQVRIIDSGAGIPPERINDVFNRYFRLSDSTRLQKGQGLGLYICRLIVQAHNGKIGVYNNRQGGSTFYFDLPVEESK